MSNIISYKIDGVAKKMYRCGKCGSFFGWWWQYSPNYCEYCGTRFEGNKETEIPREADTEKIEKILNEDWENDV